MVVDLFLPDDPSSLDFEPVQSSNVKEVAYNGFDTLFVVFHNSSHVYEYSISPSEFQAFLRAPSKGRFLLSIS